MSPDDTAAAESVDAELVVQAVLVDEDGGVYQVRATTAW